ncbi:hypothetical protein P8C59_008180 [Phyllachora maydis]|uniref:FAS1 domain-containing protein n=1 Tax=Phyllachora maydis TaxID=1825666 RepID=A0AAD9I9X8_9PEZI|nr:hypothetical protein P8C59_008180 [Phyllachora maydis]
MPPGTPPPGQGSPGQGTPGDRSNAVRLSDVMGRDRSINMFAGFARDVVSVCDRLDDLARNTTVLAPLNSAIEKLPLKPWEDASEYGALGTEAYEGDDGKERAQRNLTRFVEAHLVPSSPWPEGRRVKPLGDDKEVWWEMKDGKRVLQPGDLEVASVGSTVANGQIWIIKAHASAALL